MAHQFQSESIKGVEAVATNSISQEPAVGTTPVGGLVLDDPYTVGFNEEGKKNMLVYSGEVGGMVPTEGKRMPTGIKKNDASKGYGTIYLLQIGIELHTTRKEGVVEQAQQWMVLLRTMDSYKWGQLGQDNWDVNVVRLHPNALVAMVEELSNEKAFREKFQESAPLIKNIKALDFTTCLEIMEVVSKGNWGMGGVQLQTFEGKKGAARASVTTGDPDSRCMGLVTTIRNFMWYIGAFFHLCFLGLLDALATGIQEREHLYRFPGQLLVHTINMSIGAVFKATAVKDNISIEGVVHPSPQYVALALTAAGAEVMRLFGNRTTMRELIVARKKTSLGIMSFQ